MKRTDRLRQLIRILRDGDLHRAVDIAEKTGVTVRTVYRDMETLMASGVPMVGARGTGYRITAPITLPAMNLSMAELEALHLGLMAVAQSGEADLTEAAQTLADKLDAALPEDVDHTTTNGLAIYPFTSRTQGVVHLPALRQAIRARQKLLVTLNGQDRSVRPLRLDYWGRVWTCTVWCETTRGFDDLPIEDITALRKLPSLFVNEPGKTLADYKAARSIS
ncbi:MAG: HTH domain-containing protein [Marivivens sp.]|nr:HTH domain-containing protein [Marivivens sp.]NBT52097.1 HTH domain-containing protein [Marivivens sp.]NCW69395.1 HTH domain-containing protein [Marivivens sp.]NDH03121.1 HTH domain-containing protein [Marivivens sp.]